MFNYAFSLTDGLTIKGYKWASDLEAGKANANDYDLSKTFDYIDNYISINITYIDSLKQDFNKALEKFNNNEIGIFELSTNNIEQIKPYFTENIIAIPFLSPLNNKEYVISKDQVFIGVSKKSMEADKEKLNNFLEFVLGKVGDIDVIYEESSIYEPLYGLSSSVYDTFYKTINSYEKNQIASLYNFNIGQDYLSQAMEQYVQGKISRKEFVDYWQQDVLVSKFELNKVALASTSNDLYPKDCSMILAHAIYDQVDCDISAITISKLSDNFDNLNNLYSSSPYFIKQGDIYWDDIYNLVPQNMNTELSNSNQQKLIYSVFTGDQLINFLDNYSSDIVYCGVKKINDDYYIIKQNGTTEMIVLDGYYNFITNSNF